MGPFPKIAHAVGLMEPRGSSTETVCEPLEKRKKSLQGLPHRFGGAQRENPLFRPQTSRMAEANPQASPGFWRSLMDHELQLPNCPTN